MTARLIEPSFWKQPLDERMREMIDIRETGPFIEVPFHNELTGEDERFFAVTRFDEVVAISKDAKSFSSAQGAISIVDLPAEALEFFGSFINMDNPRHQRQRAIVAKTFTPTELAQVLDSVETISREVIDDFCEAGRGRPRRGTRPAVPAARHLRHDGHPAQRVRHRAERDEHHPRRR